MGWDPKVGRGPVFSGAQTFDWAKKKKSPVLFFVKSDSLAPLTSCHYQILVENNIMNSRCRHLDPGAQRLLYQWRKWCHVVHLSVHGVL